MNLKTEMTAGDVAKGRPQIARISDMLAKTCHLNFIAFDSLWLESTVQMSQLESIVTATLFNIERWVKDGYG